MCFVVGDRVAPRGKVQVVTPLGIRLRTPGDRPRSRADSAYLAIDAQARRAVSAPIAPRSRAAMWSALCTLTVHELRYNRTFSDLIHHPIHVDVIDPSFDDPVETCGARDASQC